MTLRPVLAYLPWHLRDAAPRAFTAVVAFAVLAGLPLSTFPPQVPGGTFATDPQLQEVARTIYSQIGSLAIVLGAIVQMNQVAAVDRDKQYFRFLFSHQVTPWIFYLQRYLVGVLLFVGVSMLIPLGFSWFVIPVSITGWFLASLLFTAYLAALALLCGAITKRDGLLLIGVFLVGSILQQLSAAGTLTGWKLWLGRILPASHAAGNVRDALMTGGDVATRDLLVSGSWTIGMLGAALFLVKRLPLAR